MSYIGVKLCLMDVATALSSKFRVLFYRTDYPPHTLPIEQIRSAILSMVIDLQIRWLAKPYVQVILDKEVEREFMRRYKLSRVDTRRTSDVQWYLVDICDFTKDPIGRFMRARDLSCTIENVFVEEDILSKGALLMAA